MDNRLTVGIVEGQPLFVEGLRATLALSGVYELLEPARSLDVLTRLVLMHSPRVVLIDKACGLPAIVEWLTQNGERTATVIWGNVLTDVDALRLLRAGAKGVIRKSADPQTLLACLDSVVNGSAWVEEGLFQSTARGHQGPRTDLTPRELQVLELVEQGLRNKEIGAVLGIRPGTVKIHLKHIFEKTGVRGRFGLALSGLRERSDYAAISA